MRFALDDLEAVAPAHRFLMSALAARRTAHAIEPLVPRDAAPKQLAALVADPIDLQFPQYFFYDRTPELVCGELGSGRPGRWMNRAFADFCRADLGRVAAAVTLAWACRSSGDSACSPRSRPG